MADTDHGGQTVESLLSSLRASAARRGATRAPLPDDIERDVREVDAGDELIERFGTEARAVGCEVRDCRGTDAWAAIAEILGQCQPGEVLVDPALPDARRQLAAAGIQTTDTWDDDRLFASAAAVTAVHGAIAESGSLIWMSGAGRARALTLVPPVHVAVVRVDQIVPDLCDFFTTLRDPPANVNLITGPSKTADIEGTLVTGIHGPGRVSIIIVD